MSAGDSSPPKPIQKTSLPSAHAAWVPLATAGSKSSKQPSSSSPAASTKPPANSQGKAIASNKKRQYQEKRPNTDPCHLAIALHHAHRIQAQKDTEALILERILELVQFPPSPSADPASPTPEDVATFKTALKPFQPSDYDELIRERNIEGLCGYGLCPREHDKDDPKVKNRIVWGPRGSGPGGRGRDMEFVPRERLEMWCSDECAERALYVKVQLQEQPAWERISRDGQEDSISLLTEARSKDSKGKGKISSHSDSIDVASRLHDIHLDQGSSTAGDLALERGDTNPAFEAGRVNVQLVEREHVSRDGARSPKLRSEDRNGKSIEGYVPKEETLTVDKDDDGFVDLDFSDHLTRPD